MPVSRNSTTCSARTLATSPRWHPVAGYSFPDQSLWFHGRLSTAVASRNCARLDLCLRSNTNRVKSVHFLQWNAVSPPRRSCESMVDRLGEILSSAVLPTLAVKSTRSIKQSEAFLASKHNQLNLFGSVDDLVTDEKKLSEAERSALEHHIRSLRAAIARELWSHEIHIGRSVLDECVLGAAKAGGGDITPRVIADLAQAGAERPGFVVYPLISFGMKMPPSPIHRLPFVTGRRFRGPDMRSAGRSIRSRLHMSVWVRWPPRLGSKTASHSKMFVTSPPRLDGSTEIL